MSNFEMKKRLKEILGIEGVSIKDVPDDKKESHRNKIRSYMRAYCLSADKIEARIERMKRDLFVMEQALITKRCYEAEQKENKKATEVRCVNGCIEENNCIVCNKG